MAISTSAAFVGNADMVEDKTKSTRETVAFVGQIPVKTRGPVQIGDYLISSGKEDGTAIAPEALLPEYANLIIGRAWESSAGGRGLVNTIVGLPETASTTSALAKQVEALKKETEALVQRFKVQGSKVQALEAKVEKMETLEAELEAIKAALNLDEQAEK